MGSGSGAGYKPAASRKRRDERPRQSVQNRRGKHNASVPKFSQIVNDASGKKTVSFDEGKNFSQNVNTSTNIKGLIGVQIDVFRAKDNTVYVNARMNRKECGNRYSGMIKENAAIINRLLADAAAIPQQDSFDVYSRLSFAYSIAVITDNFQNILKFLIPLL